MIAHIETK